MKIHLVFMLPQFYHRRVWNHQGSMVGMPFLPRAKGGDILSTSPTFS